VKALTNILRKPAPATIMATELDDARRSLLEAMSARDYANAMVEYHERRIDRLRAMLELETQQGSEQ
jgi:hypothetical protein